MTANCPVCKQNNPSGADTCSACGAPLQLASVAGTSLTLPVGTGLQGGNFTVGRVLGDGGFGITYKGSDPVLRRQVAIKELFPLGCTRQSNSIMPRLTAQEFNRVKEKFLEEAQTVARFNHSGIVKVYASFEENNTAYMVMEYLEGKTLDAVLQGGAVSEQEGVGYVKAVGEALAAVHKAGVLHRDIKPANIMVTDDDRVVLIDFGAAREFTAGQTGRMSVVLTPGYAPLEQYGQEARFAQYTDVYALGATLYHLLTGRVPVAATDRTVGVELPEPRKVNEKLSQGVNDAVMIAMAQRSSERFQTAEEFLDALKGYKSVNRVRLAQKSSSPDRQAINPNKVTLSSPRILFRSIRRGGPSQEKSLTVQNEGTGTLEASVSTDRPDIIAVRPKTIQQNKDVISIGVKTDNVAWGQTYQAAVLVETRHPPHTYRIPVSVQVDNNQTVVEEVKRLSGVAWLLAVGLGFGVGILVFSLGLDLTESIPRGTSGIVDWGLVLLVLASYIGLACYAKWAGWSIPFLVALILALILPNWLYGFYVNFLLPGLAAGIVTGLWVLLSHKYFVNSLTRDGINEKTRVLTVAKMLIPALLTLVLACGYILETVASVPLRRGAMSAPPQPYRPIIADSDSNRTMTWANGDRYHGQWRNGKQHGNGTMTWANGDRYEGRWQNGRRHGSGKLQLADGGWYEGQWANDKRSGHGTYTWPDGGRYEGQWANDKRNGRGTFTWPDGRRYEGQWRDDEISAR